jgi:hypothetical protein
MAVAAYAMLYHLQQRVANANGMVLGTGGSSSPPGSMPAPPNIISPGNTSSPAMTSSSALATVTDSS